MSDVPVVNLNDLSPEVRKRLKVRKRRTRSMTINEVRSYALRVLAVVADLSPAERGRVLRQAGRLNEV